MPPLGWWVPLTGLGVLMTACCLAWGAGLYVLAHGADDATTFLDE